MAANTGNTGRIRVHGSPVTRTQRVIWLLQELGLDFDVCSDQPLLSQHLPGPMQKQPVLVDSDGTVVCESLAINLYLCQRYAAAVPDLCPRTPQEHALTLQMTMISMTELDPRLFELLFHAPRVQEAGHPLAHDERYAAYFGRRRTATRSQRLRRELAFPLRAVENVLEASSAAAVGGTGDGRGTDGGSGGYGGGYLLPGRGFTVVDLNVSAVLEWARTVAREELREVPRTAAWLRRCLGRTTFPAARLRPGWAAFDIAAFEARYGALGCIDDGKGEADGDGARARL